VQGHTFSHCTILKLYCCVLWAWHWHLAHCGLQSIALTLLSTHTEGEIILCYRQYLFPNTFSRSSVIWELTHQCRNAGKARFLTRKVSQFLFAFVEFDSKTSTDQACDDVYECPGSSTMVQPPIYMLVFCNFKCYKPTMWKSKGASDQFWRPRDHWRAVCRNSPR
jgi:hypothetical protein